MLFTSYQFILFVLVALILYYVVPKAYSVDSTVMHEYVVLCVCGIKRSNIHSDNYCDDICRSEAYIAGRRTGLHAIIEEHKCDISRDEKKKLKNTFFKKTENVSYYCSVY